MLPCSHFQIVTDRVAPGWTSSRDVVSCPDPLPEVSILQCRYKKIGLLRGHSCCRHFIHIYKILTSRPLLFYQYNCKTSRFARAQALPCGIMSGARDFLSHESRFEPWLCCSPTCYHLLQRTSLNLSLSLGNVNGSASLPYPISVRSHQDGRSEYALTAQCVCMGQFLPLLL